MHILEWESKGRADGERCFCKDNIWRNSRWSRSAGPLTVENSNGNILAKEVKGKAEFNTSFGSIEASGLRKGVKATTGNGRISLNDVGGEAYVKTSFGSVNVQRVNGSLRVENSNGPVVANSISGDATAKMSFGSVTLDDVAGSITVDNQNGAVMVSEARTSGGCKGSDGENVVLTDSSAHWRKRQLFGEREDIIWKDQQ